MRGCTLGLLLALVIVPGQVAAHGGLPGGGGFYSGLAHPFVAIEQFLALLAFGFLLGQQGRDQLRIPLLVLPLMLSAGLAPGITVDYAQAILLGLALLMGVTVAAAPHVSTWVVTTAAALLGGIVGIDTDVPEMISVDPAATLAPYIGVFVGVFLIVMDAAALASVARKQVPRIAVRVVGSWIAAIALMVLALQFRVGAPT